MLSRILSKQRLFMLWMLIMSIALIGLTGCGKKDDQDEVAVSGPKVIASTSWTAMIAKAAGATDITILAPIELRHPPEYDFRPSDIDKVQQADYIVFAGYEPFMNKLLEATTVAEEKQLRVMTENTPDNLRVQAQMLASKFGTTAEQQAWEEEFNVIVEAIEAEIMHQNTAEIRVIVQKHMVPMARFFGYDIVAEFAEDLSPAKTAELAALNPDLIIDNYHNAQGKGLEEMTQVPRVELRNFPGEGQDSIQDLLRDNAKALGISPFID